MSAWRGLNVVVCGEFILRNVGLRNSARVPGKLLPHFIPVKRMAEALRKRRTSTMESRP